MLRLGVVGRSNHFLVAVGILAAGLFTLACNNGGGPAAPAAPMPTGSAAGATVGGEVEDPQDPDVDIEKATNGVDADQAPGVQLDVGDPVTWTYVVTNTGGFVLRRVAVTDDMIGAITCPKTELAIGESMICTATGVAAAGQYANVGTVEAWAFELPWTDSDPSHYFGNVDTGDFGCSQGYWGGHLASWAPTGYSPGQTVASVFASAAAFPAIGAATLEEALAFGGGRGVEGAARNLLRQAVASLLNAAHPDVEFPWTTADVISAVNAALDSGDRGTINSLKDDLDYDNNLGCPLD